LFMAFSRKMALICTNNERRGKLQICAQALP
jgi:hypothetical protein